MAKCTECGAAVAGDLKFCGYCGAKLNIVSEHVGTRILGNTQVLIDAVSRIAPVEQYVVLGTVTDGKLADGLILSQAHEGRDRLLWSDGEKLTEIVPDHVLNAWGRGAFEWHPALTDTCPACLTTYHRTRGYPGGSGVTDPSSVLRNCSPGVQPFGPSRLFYDPKPMWCPACLVGPVDDLAEREAAFFRSNYRRLEVCLPGMRETLRENLAEYLKPKHFKDRKARERSRANAESAQEEIAWIAPAIDTLEWLSERSLRCVAEEVSRFRAFAETLPAILSIPPASLASWEDYWMHFVRGSGGGRREVWWLPGINSPKPSLSIVLPFALAQDPQVVQRLRECVPSRLLARFPDLPTDVVRDRWGDVVR